MNTSDARPGDAGAGDPLVDLSWASKGACADLVQWAGPAERNRLFFPMQGQPTEPGKAICRRCPVIEQCLDHALKFEKYGIWGGTSEKQRRQMRAELGIRFRSLSAWMAPTCGTTAAYDHHRRNGETPCDACRVANNEASARRRQQRRSA